MAVSTVYNNRSVVEQHAVDPSWVLGELSLRSSHQYLEWSAKVGNLVYS